MWPKPSCCNIRLESVFQRLDAAVILVACLLVLLSGCEQEIPNKDWRDFKFAGDALSVKMPNRPSEKVSALRLPTGNADQRTYTTSSRGCVYKAMYLDYPDTPLQRLDADGILDRLCESTASAFYGHVRDLKTISIDSYLGRSFVIATKDGKPSAYCRFYMIHNRLVQLMAIVREYAQPLDDIDVFLHSLIILRSR